MSTGERFVANHCLGRLIGGHQYIVADYRRQVTDLGELISFYRSYGMTFSSEEPVYAEVCDRLGDHPELVELIAAHEPDAQQPNLLFAAVHYLLLGGLDHPLSAVYAGTSDAAPTPLFTDLVMSNRVAVDELLATRRTQTNEVGRSAVLALMLNDAQHRVPGPLAWIDLGASAGLNLNCDRFCVDYELGGRTLTTGRSDALVRLGCQVRDGGPPIEARHAEIAWRVGIDRAPIDTTDPDQARWLQACLWPSKTERHERLDAAIAVASQFPPRVIEADAAAGVALALAEAPADLVVVMTTTWVWYYLPEPTRRSVLDAVRASGRRVLWYSLEGKGVVAELGGEPHVDVDCSVMGLVELGTEAEPTVFGESHPHGAWIDWTGDKTP